jgi:hypothetical protein
MRKGGRGIICKTARASSSTPKAKRWLASEHEPVKVDIAEWHEYTVIAQGNHLIHKIDGQVTIDLLDFEEAKRSLEGLDRLPDPSRPGHEGPHQGRDAQRAARGRRGVL